jgi:putative heme iron utilization protein
MLVSRLAEHTKNLLADPRASLLARDEGSDAQAGARVTLLGRATTLEPASPAASRYQRFFPDSGKLFALGDFAFIALDPIAVRFIEGFGSIHWLSAEDYAPPVNTLADAEADIVVYMNSEHSLGLLDYCRHEFGSEASEAMMIGLDCDGFDLCARYGKESRLLRFDFEQPVADARSARAALAAWTGRWPGDHVTSEG